MQPENVARRHFLAKPRLVDSEQIDSELFVEHVESKIDEHGGGLRHRLDYQNPGHDRFIGKMPGKLRLIHCDVLYPDRADRLFQVHDLVYHQKRIPMRNHALDHRKVGGGQRSVFDSLHKSKLHLNRPNGELQYQYED